MKSPLGLKAARQNMTDEELFRTAGLAWRKRGWAAFQIDGLLDEWLKQAVTNHCNKLYGEREAE